METVQTDSVQERIELSLPERQSGVLPLDDCTFQERIYEQLRSKPGFD